MVRKHRSIIDMILAVYAFLGTLAAALAINYGTEGTAGRGSRGAPMFVRHKRPLTMQTGTFDFDNSYVNTGTYSTSGFSISALWDRFKTMEMVNVLPRLGYVFDVDMTNKRVHAYRQSAATGALAEVANAVDLSAVVGVRWLAYGYF